MGIEWVYPLFLELEFSYYWFCHIHKLRVATASLCVLVKVFCLLPSILRTNFNCFFSFRIRAHVRHTEALPKK
jgi:hypothetical protein